MSDDISIMDQGHDLQVSVSKLNELKVEISNSMQVRAIVTKRPPIGLDTEKKKKKNYGIPQKVLLWNIF